MASLVCPLGVLGIVLTKRSLNGVDAQKLGYLLQIANFQHQPSATTSSPLHLEYFQFFGQFQNLDSLTDIMKVVGIWMGFRRFEYASNYYIGLQYYNHFVVQYMDFRRFLVLQVLFGAFLFLEDPHHDSSSVARLNVVYHPNFRAKVNAGQVCGNFF